MLTTWFTYAIRRSKISESCIKRILRLFERSSGLIVNFGKCKLFGINILIDDLETRANLLNCEVERGQFVYLGMRVGVNSHRRDSWNWLIQKIKNRIARYDGRNITLGEEQRWSNRFSP